jgi:hypothetical protein
VNAHGANANARSLIGSAALVRHTARILDSL